MRATLCASQFAQAFSVPVRPAAASTAIPRPQSRASGLRPPTISKYPGVYHIDLVILPLDRSQRREYRESAFLLLGSKSAVVFRPRYGPSGRSRRMYIAWPQRAWSSPVLRCLTNISNLLRFILLHLSVPFAQINAAGRSNFCVTHCIRKTGFQTVLRIFRIFAVIGKRPGF